MCQTLTPDRITEISSVKQPAAIQQRRPDEEEEVMALVEAEAKLVIDAITEKRATARSRSASTDGVLDDARSKSASIEILDDVMMEEQAFHANGANSCVNTLERNKRLKTTIVDIDLENDDEEDERTPPAPVKTGPRICKPSEAVVNEEEAKAVRGRRKGLYSSPVKKPPIATKPSVAPKPRNITSKSPPPISQASPNDLYFNSYKNSNTCSPLIGTRYFEMGVSSPTRPISLNPIFL